MIANAALFLFFFFGATCFYFGLVSLAYYPLALIYPLWEKRLLQSAQAQRYAPSVSVLVPAYNEEKTIAASLRSILSSDYPDFEVIVINDGSTDRTEQEVQALLGDPHLRYLKKENGGKALALNFGLAAARGEIVLFTDADSIFEARTIRNGVAYLADPGVGAVSGNDTVLMPQGPLQKMLVITSHIGTGFVRRALSLIGVLQIISGNLGFVRTEVLRRIGGFRPIWGEDLEVTLRLKRHGVRVVYGASTRVLSECPGTLAGLWKQRVRWLRSFIKILWMHREMVGNPRYGWFGPFLAFNAFNMIVIPVLQAMALLLLPFVLWQGKFGFHGVEWIAYLGLGFLMAAAVVAILLDKTPRDFLYLPYAALLLFFSHFYNAVVLYSIWGEARAHDEAWNKLERRGIRARATGQAFSVAASFNILVAFAWVGLIAGCLWWVAVAHGEKNGAHHGTVLAQKPVTTAVAIHFDAWPKWRDAYEHLLAVPESRFVDRVGVSAGRADWTYFRWPGNESWWSAEQRVARTDMLEHTLTVLHERGYRTTAIFDVLGERYLRRHPSAAARDLNGRRSKMIICSTELAEGAAGNHLARAVDALAKSTQADTIAVTELFYGKHCYDDRCLTAFRKATGRKDWPRTAKGAIDYRSPVIGEWRSKQVAAIASRLSAIVHSHGKKFALDVKAASGNALHDSIEYGQDFHLLAPHVDEFVVWDYSALDNEPPERASRVAGYFDDEFGADRFYLSIGLWAPGGTISAETFARALRSAREGGATKLWITPEEKMSGAHWSVLANAVRAANPEAVSAHDK